MVPSHARCASTLILLALHGGACGGDGATDSPSETSATTVGMETSSGATASTSTVGSLEGSRSTTQTGTGSDSTDSSASTSLGTTGQPMPNGWVPALEGYQLRCKLISDRDVDDPTDNDTQHRFNLRGTDLGIPLVIGDALHLFFGDTHGYRAIWDVGEDPDSVGIVDAATVAADPSALCTELAFYVTPDDPSVAAGVDPSILRDFAAGTMNPPPGEALSDYITQFPAPFSNIPGSFEVPSGALRSGEDVYLFWAGKSEFEPYPRMTLSYLARWDEPRVLPSYQIVRPFDALDQGPLGGHFLQVLPFVREDVVYILGTGDFRHSGVYLGRFALDSLETGTGVEVFDPEQQTWLDPTVLDSVARAAVPPVFESDGVGELGGLFVEGPDHFLVMYQRELHAPDGTISDNRIVFRTAADIAGPWSDAITVIDMADPGFMGTHCCGATGCDGEQILNCFAAGLYAAYPLPHAQVLERDDGGFDVGLAFVASTWNPYNVVLFEAQVSFDPIRD